MYLLRDEDHKALEDILFDLKLNGQHAQADLLDIVLRNTVKDEPVGYVYGKDTP